MRHLVARDVHESFFEACETVSSMDIYIGICCTLFLVGGITTNMGSFVYNAYAQIRRLSG